MKAAICRKKVRGPLTIALRKNFLRPIYLANSSNFFTQKYVFLRLCVMPHLENNFGLMCKPLIIFSKGNIMTVLSNSTIDGLSSVWPKGLKLVGDRKKIL